MSLNGRSPTASRFCPVCSKAGRLARRSALSSETKIRGARTTARSLTPSAPDTPIILIGRNTACATIAAAAGPPLARPRSASPRARYGVEVRGHLAQLGPNRIAFKSWDAVSENPFFCPDPAIVPRLEQFMDELRASGDSCGAPVYGRLDSDIASAMMGINAVKGVEIGAGFAAVEQKGSEHGDELTPRGFLSNNAGGTLGGISTGQDILVSIALKPTSSIRVPRRSIDRKGEPTTVQTTGRHDPCVGIRATPIAEAMLACVLMDHALRHRAQCGDVNPPIRPIPGKAR